MSAAHTPGPWAFGLLAGNHQASVHSEATGRTVALVYDPDNADARLIAAAPELLEALRVIGILADGADDLVSIRIAGLAADAITKATGEG
jgi:hypothetical protein